MNDINPPAVVRQETDFRPMWERYEQATQKDLSSALDSYLARRERGAALAEIKAKCKPGTGQWTRELKQRNIPERTAQALIKFHKYEPASLAVTDQEALIYYTEKWKAAHGNPGGSDDDDDSDDKPTPPKAFYTLKEWDELGDKEKAEAFAIGGDLKFNDQGDNDNIEWALWSWNPVTGCRHDCPYCYARDIANRFYQQRFEPSFYPPRLKAPQNTPFPEAKAREWVGHKNVFVCSMADLFGRWVPADWIEAVLKECRDASQWNFLFLTKFPQRMSEFDFPDNSWVGTTVDCQARVKNAEKAFRKVKAGVKWLSVEPMLEPLTFDDLSMFDWLVIGGASRSAGGDKGPTPEWKPPREWVIDLETKARECGVKVYEKTNLFADRIREYPGVEPGQPPELPEALKYLPMIG